MESLYFRRGFIPLEARSKGAADTKRVLLLTGFTLIELMVVMAIIAVVMTIVLTSQSSFNKTLTLANSAYDVALTIRYAETYGLGSRAVGTMTNAGYGVHFQNAPSKSFALFSDKYPSVGQSGLCHVPPVNDPTGPDARPGNCVFDVSQSEGVTDYTLGNNITISDFCAYSSGSWSCASGGLSSLDIVFVRPNVSPFMSVNGSYLEAFPVTKACLTISSPQGGSRFVSVSSSGQIIANASSDPSSCHE